MANYYANERNILILVSLLKEHGIKKAIVSPGTTNLSFVACLQCDPFFEIYSCVDERSAAYMACGLAAETGEPVMLSCTGATASRNYVSALTEAYYRKLPVLAITGTQSTDRIGQLQSQLIDRSQAQKDIIKLSVDIRSVSNDEEAHDAMIYINRAITELTRNGGGPVHINLRTRYIRDYSITKLPKVQVIKRLDYGTLDYMPEMPNGRIGIFVGSHKTFTPELTEAVDLFCASRDAVVFCDHTSGYYGNYKVNFSLVASQTNYKCELLKLDLCIHIGEISAEYGTLGYMTAKHPVWRVSNDGEIRDQFFKLQYIFALEEKDFFNYYTLESSESYNDYYCACQEEIKRTQSLMPDVPFSNIWIASILSSKLPKGACLHLGILNSTRAWNLFQLDKSITSFANVGGFGIDGGVSSLIGASLAHKDKLYFGIVGDLAFFYDMNVLGNRHVGNNVRLLIVNNGKGTEFRNFYHPGALFGDDADKYMAAAGHFGNKSQILIKNYAEALGYVYIAASSKEEFLSKYKSFIDPDLKHASIIFEVFTNNEDESDALKQSWSILSDMTGILDNKMIKLKLAGRRILGEKGLEFVKKLMKLRSK